MANISQLSMTFVDGSTVINADKMNGIVSKINELVTAVNNGSTPVQQTVATPVINISGNTATITCATSGATIKYTTDGSTPSASNGSTYSSAITLNASCTIEAIAIKSGMTNSSVASQRYTVQSVTPVAPTMVLNTSAKTVALSAPSGLTIKYSTDGSAPATTYASAINVANGATIKAITTNGSQSSSVPKITVTYNESSGTIEFATSETGTIRYTTDGSNPTASSTAYASAINPVSGTTYKIAVYNGSTINSEIATVQISA
jgi:hypothetical protein